MDFPLFLLFGNDRNKMHVEKSEVILTFYYLLLTVLHPSKIILINTYKTDL